MTWETHTAELLIALGQIIMIDLVLAGDNAIVVGMAAASVPVDQRRRVIVWGTAAAVGLRIAFALVAVQLLKIIGLTLAGGILLVFVVYQMYQELRGRMRGPEVSDAAARGGEGGRRTVRSAVLQVAMADLSMSLDNVLAVAGAARDHIGVLIAGLLISVIMMAFAATLIARLIYRHRWIAWLGLLIIAYVAGDMIWRGAFQVADAID